MRERAEEIKLSKERRAQALTELRRTCPYAETIAAIKPSAERTRKPTKARVAAEEQIRAQLLAPALARETDGAHAMPRHGFTAEKVCSDLRWRIMNTLAEMGLQKSAYARSAVQMHVFSNPKMSKEHLTTAPALQGMFR